MKYLVLLLVLVLSGCTMDRQTNTKVHLFNPFYRPGGNPTYISAYTSQTPDNMGEYK